MTGHCRSCHAVGPLEPVLDLGDQHLSDFSGALYP